MIEKRAVCLAVAVLFASPAGATTIGGGATTFIFSSDFAGNPVLVSPTGGAVSGPGHLNFFVPETGGSFPNGSLSMGSIEHQGSGFDFVFGPAMVSVQNLRFDFTKMDVVGDLSDGPDQESGEVFKLKRCTDHSQPCTGETGAPNEFGLFLRPDAAHFFNDAVPGRPHFQPNDQIALAIVNPSEAPVPEAGLGPLSLMGLSAAWLGRIRRSRARVTS
ncbi:MAG TPA: hypothetical protein VMR50_19475 [Myxococcota bacterium]|nr:hypothetical protein [Myxococcota bacterium]